eukprot:6181849-Pleurochrysis_carterae.AAC.3
MGSVGEGGGLIPIGDSLHGQQEVKGQWPYTAKAAARTWHEKPNAAVLPSRFGFAICRILTSVSTSSHLAHLNVAITNKSPSGAHCLTIPKGSYMLAKCTLDPALFLAVLYNSPNWLCDQLVAWSSTSRSASFGHSFALFASLPHPSPLVLFTRAAKLNSLKLARSCNCPRAPWGTGTVA